MLLRSGITNGLLVLYKACVGLNLDKSQVLLFYETDFMQYNATLMALTAALAMTLGTAPAEQPGYAGHFILTVFTLSLTVLGLYIVVAYDNQLSGYSC